MKLLIITQKVDKNDPILGFFHRWIVEFAKNVESVIVITLEKGEYDLPENVRVFSLGKEKKKSRLKYLFRFYSYIWRERKNYDAVFVHMNPIYVIFGGLFWKLWHKKISLWYTHKKVDMKLRIAEKMTDVIFSASKESFRLSSRKLIITGHGIDTEIFKPLPKIKSDCIRLATIGRITETKNLSFIVDVFEIFKNNLAQKTIIKIIGRTMSSLDENYKKNLSEKISNLNLSHTVSFAPSVANETLPELFREIDATINVSATGSTDKAVLESMSCGVPVFTTNEAFRDTLGPLGFYVPFNNPTNLALVISLYFARGLDMSKELRLIVLENHSLKALVPKIISQLRDSAI